MLNVQKKVTKTASPPLSPPGNDTLAILQRIITETTGNDLEDITLDADLQEDLGINMISEFPVIISKLQQAIPDVTLPIHMVKDCATVAELVEVIDEERDL
jgi:acyl carrier protein